jgi:hypothetical protein
MKSRNPNFVEPSEPLQACNGTALPLPLPYVIKRAVLEYTYAIYLFIFVLYYVNQ